jgi:hypothetical protein
MASKGLLRRISLSDSLTSRPLAVVVDALMRIDRFFDVLKTPSGVLSVIFVVVMTVNVYLYLAHYRSKTPTPLSTEQTVVSVLLFSDTFDRDADTFEPPWDLARRAATDRLTTDPTVVRKGTHSAKFQVHDSDGLAGTTDSRALLENQGRFCEGADRYLGWSWYLPANFPASMPSGSWITIGQIGHGPPGDYSPLHFSYAGSSINLINHQHGQWRTVGSIPTQRGQWQDVVAHVKFSKSTSIGFVELWLNGQPVTLSSGSTRQYMNTINQNNASGCGNWMLTLWRNKGYWEWLTLYYDEAKVGTSYAAVARSRIKRPK